MINIAIIIFREVLEIALILSVLFSATIGIKNRSLWINSGLLIGILGSIIIATLTDKISSAFDGIGHEIFNAAILFFSALMIGYTVIWMKHHSKALSKNIKTLSKKVIDGKKSVYALLIIVALSVLREGAEIVLFTYSYYMSGTSVYDLILGGVIGLFAGIIVGFAFYFGLVKNLGKYFFSVTTAILAFLSAGLIAKSLGYLTNVGIIGDIKTQLWDTSFIISDDTVIGDILNILFGYISRPSAIQVIGYIATLAILFIFMHVNNKSFAKKHSK